MIEIGAIVGVIEASMATFLGQSHFDSGALQNLMLVGMLPVGVYGVFTGVDAGA